MLQGDVGSVAHGYICSRKAVQRGNTKVCGC
jgi:hypothetical protein